MTLLMRFRLHRMWEGSVHAVGSTLVPDRSHWRVWGSDFWISATGGAGASRKAQIARPQAPPESPPLSTFKAAFVKSELRALYEHGLDAAWEDHCKRPWSLALGLAWRGHRATCFAGHGHREAK